MLNVLEAKLPKYIELNYVISDYDQYVSVQMFKIDRYTVFGIISVMAFFINSSSGMCVLILARISPFVYYLQKSKTCKLVANSESRSARPTLFAQTQINNKQAVQTGDHVIMLRSRERLNFYFRVYLVCWNHCYKRTKNASK